VDERIYEAVAELMADPLAGELVCDCSWGALTSRPKQSFKTFIYDRPGWRSNPIGGTLAITLLEEQVAVQAGTTGLRTW
jgi:hypothetical protein